MYITFFDSQDLSKQPDPSQATGRLTRAERARLEALHSFGGSGLGDVMGGAKKCVARTLEPKCKENGEFDNDTSKNEEQNDKENLVIQVIA